MSRIAIIVTSVLAASSVQARMPSEPVDHSGGASSIHSAAVADATQLQGQQQGQAQVQGQIASGGDSVSYGGGGTVKTNHDQAQSVSISSPRQVGMLYLPTMIPPSCGAAIAAGNGNTRNVTAGGISWTTERCWSVLIAADYERMGAYREACEIRRDVLRKQIKRINKQRAKAKLPPFVIDCEEVELQLREAIAAAAMPEPALPAVDYATTEQLRRAFEGAMGKGGK